MTTIVSVRRDDQVVVGGDGQVSLGNTVMKGTARKVRRLAKHDAITGFAGVSLSCQMPSYRSAFAVCRRKPPTAPLW